MEIIEEALNDFEFDMIRHRIYGFNIPSDNEYEIMSLVSNSLKKEPINVKTDDMSSDEAIKAGILSISIFNKKYINKLINILFYNYDLDKNDFRTKIEFHKRKGKVREIMIPEVVTKLAPIWIGHECIHCLKDTNYNEYIDKDIFSEVLPLFYEMIASNTIFKDIHDIWKKERLNTLINNKNLYELAKKNIADENNSSVYRFIMYSYGQYLTSYFNALNLYSIYKDNPKLVLKYVNKVLSHKMNTFELLNEFDLNQINKKNVNTYVYEHANI